MEYDAYGIPFPGAGERLSIMDEAAACIRGLLRDDKTYPFKRNLREGRNSFAYPIAFQALDGKIHVVYTSDRRTVINHAVFDEEWVLAGSGAPNKR